MKRGKDSQSGLGSHPLGADTNNVQRQKGFVSPKKNSSKKRNNPWKTGMHILGGSTTEEKGLTAKEKCPSQVESKVEETTRLVVASKETKSEIS